MIVGETKLGRKSAATHCPTLGLPARLHERSHARTPRKGKISDRRTQTPFDYIMSSDHLLLPERSSKRTLSACSTAAYFFSCVYLCVLLTQLNHTSLVVACHSFSQVTHPARERVAESISFSSSATRHSFVP